MVRSLCRIVRPWGLVAVVLGVCGASSCPAAVLHGTVQSGGTGPVEPLANVQVRLFEATLLQPLELGSATTDAAGEFDIDAPYSTSSSIFFATADVSAGVKFVVILGQNLPPETTINELTTVAAAYSMAQLSKSGAISGDPFALQIAAGMNDNLVDSATGESSPVLLASPNGDETNSLRSTRSLANLLAACVRDRVLTNIFLLLTRPEDALPPADTAQALACLARRPAHNVLALYALSKLRDIYSPALLRCPDAWTVTVKVNDSGSDQLDEFFAGPGYMVFDDKGYAWLTNNVKQGVNTSSLVVVVLQPNGKPADGSNGTPVSPLSGGGILGTGFGVTIAPNGDVWFGNFGWGGENPTATGNGSLSKFSPTGLALSPPLGIQGGPVRAQAVRSDSKGNIWIASYGNDSIFVFPKGDPNKAVGFQQYPGSDPFDLQIAPDGTAWVTNGGGLAGQNPSSVAKFEFVNGKLKRKFLHFVGKALKGLAVDSQGNAWVTSQGDSTIYVFRPNGTRLGAFSGGGINGPWGATVDGDDNVWIANFGPLEFGNNFTDGRLSLLAGDNPKTRPAGKRVGAPLTPRTGYTVHSAGSQVLLPNGDPLYGANASPSFAPMMRQTATCIDRAGNLWTLNNWKPEFTSDVLSNPGGDGIIIFVGLATPPKN